ncbi:DUF6414 family protein [Actinomyces howellii]|uniref:DUF6414 family protein n=2 Tax=Actinomyces howellii TaxID=52771 RepID=UPI003B228E3A
MWYEYLMLFKTQYLDQETLLSYVASIEGGVRQSGSSKSMTSHGVGGGLVVGPARAQADRKGEEEMTLTLEDHDSARLARLIDAGHKDPENLAWISVSNPDDDFEGIGYGAMIEWECDIHIPEGILALSRVDEVRSFLDMAANMIPVAQEFNLDMDGLPDAKQLSTMRKAIDSIEVTPVVVGEDDDTGWRVVGALDRKWINAGSNLEGRVCILGKVTKIVSEGRWYPLVSLPGMNIVGRKERREMERRGPKAKDEEAQYLEGPLLVVDYLAIYS